jgi:hypothetical protein
MQDYWIVWLFVFISLDCVWLVLIYDFFWNWVSCFNVAMIYLLVHFLDKNKILSFSVCVVVLITKSYIKLSFTPSILFFTIICLPRSIHDLRITFSHMFLTKWSFWLWLTESMCGSLVCLCLTCSCRMLFVCVFWCTNQILVRKGKPTYKIFRYNDHFIPMANFKISEFYFPPIPNCKKTYCSIFSSWKTTLSFPNWFQEPSLVST